MFILYLNCTEIPEIWVTSDDLLWIVYGQYYCLFVTMTAYFHIVEVQPI